MSDFERKVNIDFLQEELDKFRKLKRTHASFFLWPDKQASEIGIGMDFFQKLEEIQDEYLVNIHPGNDPPDVEIVTSENRVIGVEITELVNQKAIEYSIKDDVRYFDEVVSWNRENTIEAIERIIKRKNEKCSNIAGNYETLVLLIFTDEDMLISDTLRTYFEGHDWENPELINEAYILTGYEPRYGTKGLIRLF